MNTRLLEAAEQLVNQLNDRARQRPHRSLLQQKSRPRKGGPRKPWWPCLRFRSQRGVVDPERQTMMQLQQVAKLQDELIAAKTQIAQLKAFAPENPQLASLQLRVRTLQERNGCRAREGGRRRSTPSPSKAADFQRLALEREFAERSLAAALGSLEQARNEAQRKQLYLERIVQPSTPDIGDRAAPTTVGAHGAASCGLVAWGIAALLSRQHPRARGLRSRCSKLSHRFSTALGDPGARSVRLHDA